MKAVAIALVFSLAATSFAAETDRPAKAVEALAERQDAFLAAMEAKDAERAGALFAGDAILHIANRPALQGRTAIQQFYATMFGFLSASQATPELMEIAACGDMAYAIGSVANEFRGPQGATKHLGKYLLVWRKLEGEWRIAVYSVSSNEPAAPR
jgi:uncharacterized protein (TIGR02246 family)